jgi:hypothetical protein
MKNHYYSHCDNPEQCDNPEYAISETATIALKIIVQIKFAFSTLQERFPGFLV